MSPSMSGRIALVGAMGAGKSSVLSYALTPSEGFAPLPISVAPESDETVTDPGNICVNNTTQWPVGLARLDEGKQRQRFRAVNSLHQLHLLSRDARADRALTLLQRSENFESCFIADTGTLRPRPDARLHRLGSREPRGRRNTIAL
jgi:hypothetical protein